MAEKITLIIDAKDDASAILKKIRKGIEDVDAGAQGAGKGVGGLNLNLGSLKTLAGGAIVAGVTAQLAGFTKGALEAADKINGVKRGLEVVLGTAQAAEQRFDQLNEIAKLPGLDPAPLAKYDAIFTNLGNTAKQNDIIFTGTAKAITTFGGNVHSVNSVLTQLSQGFGKNKIDAQDIKSIIEQTGGSFITVAQDVLNFKGGVEALRAEHEKSGKHIREFLLPVFEEMGNRFEGMPIDSYSNRIDNLGVAFTNLAGTIGQKMLPAASEWIGDLTTMAEDLTNVIQGTKDLDEITKTFVQTLATVSPENFTKTLESQLAALTTRLGELNEKYPELKTNAEKLAETFANTRIGEAAQEYLKLNSQLTIVKGTLEGTKGTIESFGIAKDALKEKIAAVETELRKEEQALEDFGRVGRNNYEEYDKLQQTISELKEELKNLNKGLANTEKAQDNVQASMLEVKEIADPVKRSVQNAGIEFDTLNSKTAEYTKTNNNLVTSLGDLNEKLKPIEPVLQDIKPYLTPATLAKFKQGIDGVNGELDALNPKLIKAESILNILDPTTISTGESVDEVDKGIANFNGTLGDYVESLNSTKESGEKLHTTITTIKASLDLDVEGVVSPLQKIIDKANDVGTQVPPAIEDAKKSFEDLATELPEVEEKINDVYDALDKITAEAAPSARRELDTLIDIWEDLGIEVDDNYESLERTLNLFKSISAVNEFATALGRVDSAFQDIGKASSSVLDTLGSMLTLDITGFLASIPNLAINLTKLTDPGGPTVEERMAPLLSAIKQIEDSDKLDASQKQELTTPISNFIKQMLIGAIRSGGPELLPTLTAKYTGLATSRGFDFDFDRDVAMLEGMGKTLPGFREGIRGLNFDLVPIITEVARLEESFNTTDNVEPSATPMSAGISGGITRSGQSSFQQNSIRALEPHQRAYLASLGYNPDDYGYNPSKNAFYLMGGDTTQPQIIYDDSVKPDSPSSTTVSPTPPARPKTGSFRFTISQQNRLQPFLDEAQAAEDAFDYFDENTPLHVLQAAYTRLANAEDAVLQERIKIINETSGYTEDQKIHARNQWKRVFNTQIQKANKDFEGALDDIGHALVYGLTETSGILVGSMLKAEELPEEVKKAVTPKPTESKDSSPKADPLKEVFRYTAAQNVQLSILQDDVNEAQRAVDLLDKDSTQQEITAAYKALTDAETALRDKKLEYVNTSTEFSEAALEAQRELIDGDFNSEIHKANLDLVDAFKNIGRVLVTALTATSGILTGAALDAEEIPENIESKTPDKPKEVFRYTAAQNVQLSILQDDVNEAQRAVDLLDKDSTQQQITAAYKALTDAETALRDKKLEYVNTSTEFSEAALEAQRELIDGDFNSEIHKANLDLVDAFKNIGRVLVTALTATSGILTGAALDAEEIPENIESKTPDKPKEVFRYTAAQNVQLSILQDDVNEAQRAVDLLDKDSTQQEITAAYKALTDAETALRDKKLEYVNTSTEFSEAALEAQRELIDGDFNSEIHKANLDLVDAFKNIGRVLVTALTATSGILTGAALDTEKIPENIESKTPDKPKEVFRYTAAQNVQLSILQDDVNEAQRAVDLLDKDSTQQEITAAYKALTDAETALRDKKLEYVNTSTEFSEAALEAQRELIDGDFNSEIHKANLDLVDAFKNIGRVLVTALTATSGILTGAALDTEKIPEEIKQKAPKDIGNNLLENAIHRARFELTGATSEQGFESKRRNLLKAITDFYDAEEIRINGLELSEEELQDLREDNTLKRRQAIKSVTDMENRFANERIKLEEEIEEVKNKQLDNEAERLAKIQDANEAHADKIKQIQERLNDDLLDMEESRLDKIRDLHEKKSDSLVDLRTRIARRMFDEAVKFDDLTDEQKKQVLGSTEYKRGAHDIDVRLKRGMREERERTGVLNIGSAGYNFWMKELQEGRFTDRDEIEIMFGDKGLAIFDKMAEATESADESLEKNLTNINAQAKATARELGNKLLELGVVSAPEENQQESVVASAQKIAADTQITAGSGLLTASDELKTAAVELKSANTSISKFFDELSLDDVINVVSQIPKRSSPVDTAELPFHYEKANSLARMSNRPSQGQGNMVKFIQDLTKHAIQSSGTYQPDNTGMQPIILQVEIPITTKIGDKEIVEIQKRNVELDQRFVNFSN